MGTHNGTPYRPRSSGSLVKVDSDFLFFPDGGRSAPTALANAWKRPSTTRGASYSQFASMLHLASFSDQVCNCVYN